MTDWVTALGGVVIGAFLTWGFGLVSEIQKAKLQMAHTKFTSYYAKQVEVLANLYKLLNKTERIATSAYKQWQILIKQAEEASDPDFKLDKEPFINYYSSLSKGTFKEYSTAFLELQSYSTDNAVYLDENFELQIANLVRQFEILLQRHNEYISLNYIEGIEPDLNIWQAYYYLNNELPHSLEEIKGAIKAKIA